MIGSIYRARNGQFLKIILEGESKHNSYTYTAAVLQIDYGLPIIQDGHTIFRYDVKTLTSIDNLEWDLMELVESPIFKKEGKK